MTDRVAAFLRRLGIHPDHRALGVAVSGGADSVFLLHVLRELGWACAILHVNHRLRGDESEADEEFVRRLAAQCGLPVHVFIAPVSKGNIEQEARKCRYEFFAERIGSGHCSLVATGHTLDDQAETVLHRFLRGSGTAGLSGIRPLTTSGIVRPIIDLRRSDIREWLLKRDYPWREDASNGDAAFTRNRIRNQHMPELRASINPALPEVLAAMAQWAQGEEDYWTAALEPLEHSILIREPETVRMHSGRLLELPLALQRRLLRKAIEIVRGSLRGIDFRHVEFIRCLTESSEGSGRVQLPGIDVYRSFDWLRLAPLGCDTRVPRDFAIPVTIPGRTEVSSPRLTIDVELVSGEHVYNDEVDGLDWERCAGSLFLRNWRPGDHYHAPGRPGTEKIKTLFQEFRIPLWDRRTWPVIESKGSIVWSRAFGVAHDCSAKPGNKSVLLIREVRESNTPLTASIQLKRAHRPASPAKVQPGAEVL